MTGRRKKAAALQRPSSDDTAYWTGETRTIGDRSGHGLSRSLLLAFRGKAAGGRVNNCKSGRDSRCLLDDRVRPEEVEDWFRDGCWVLLRSCYLKLLNMFTSLLCGCEVVSGYNRVFWIPEYFRSLQTSSRIRDGVWKISASRFRNFTEYSYGIKAGSVKVRSLPGL